MEMLAMGYVMVLLQAAFLGGKHYPEGKPVEVSRESRNAMIAGRIARDATDEEIAKFRGVAEGETADDGALSAAKTELASLETQKTDLANEVSALELSKQTLASDVEALELSKQALAGEAAALGETKQALADEVAKLEKAKKAAAAKAT